MKQIIFLLIIAFISVSVPNNGLSRGSAPPLSISPSIKTALHEGQVVKFSANGGSPPYKFTANIGSINVSTGDYTAPSKAGLAIIKVKDAKGRIATYTVPVFLNLEGVFKYYSVYPSSEEDIEAGKKGLPPIIHLFKKDGSFKSCMLDELKNKLDEEISSETLNYKILGNNALLIMKKTGEKVPLGFNRLSEAQIKLTGQTPLGFGSIGIRGVTVVLEKSPIPSGTSLDDYFKKSCEDLELKSQYAYNIQRYLDSYACPNGRINPINFSASQFYSGTGNSTQIQGNFQQTPIGGNASNSYIGVNAGSRDVIAITKMTDGTRVLGFNVSLFLCRTVTQVQPYYGVVTIPLIDQSRLPVVAGTDRPIIVTDPTNCSVGTVDQAVIYIKIPAYQVPNTGVVYQAVQLPLAFSRGSCL